MTTAEKPVVDRRFFLNRIGMLAVAVGLLLAIFSLTLVETGQIGVVVRAGSADAPRILNVPGIYIRMPFVERVWLVDTRLQTLEQGTAQPYKTADHQTLQLAVWAAWRVTDPARFAIATAAGKNPLDERLIQTLASSLTDLLSTQTASNVAPALPAGVQQQWQERANAQLAALGVTADLIGLRDVGLSVAAIEVINTRMIAARTGASERLAQGLVNDTEQLLTLQNTQREQLLDAAYKAAYQKRQAADAQITAAYVRQYGGQAPRIRLND